MLKDTIYQAVVAIRQLLHPNGIRKTVNNIPCRYTAIYCKGVPVNIRIKMLDSLLEKVKDAAVVLELGGHIGIWTELIANSMPANGKLFVFEPNPNTYKTLAKQIAVSLSTHKITGVNKAVGEQDGTLKFEMFPDRSRSFEKSAKSKILMSGAAEEGGVLIDVPVISVDKFCSEKGIVPDVIKVDIEGAELPALKGMVNILKQGKTKLVIEMHQFAWADFGYTGEDFISFVATQLPNYVLMDGDNKEITRADSTFLDNNKLGFVTLQPR